MSEAWFIEREVGPDGRECPGSGDWQRYAGAFDRLEGLAGARSYFDRLCPNHYRIVQYTRGLGKVPAPDKKLMEALDKAKER